MAERRPNRFIVIWGYFSGRLTNVLIFVAIIYFLVIVGRSMFASYHDRQSLNNRKAEIMHLRAEVIYLENQNLYYQTISYKEKEARKKLGFIKPGETVVALNRTNAQPATATVAINNQSINQPNYLKWWDYFFGE